MNTVQVTPRRDPVDTLRNVLLVRGVAFAVMGAVAIVFPGMVAGAPVPALAGLLAVDGALAISAAVLIPAMPARRGIPLLHGVASLALAALVFSAPEAGLSSAWLFLAGWLALAGLLHVALGLGAGKSISARSWWVAGLSMALGMATVGMVSADAGRAAVTLVTASSALCIGVISAWIAVTPKRFLGGGRR